MIKDDKKNYYGAQKYALSQTVNCYLSVELFHSLKATVTTTEGITVRIIRTN